MKIAVFDCPMGIAGDMTVGALLDLGIPLDLLKSELKKLHLHGYRIDLRQVRCGAFRAAKFSASLNGNTRHHRTGLREIEAKIRAAKLESGIKGRAIDIFRSLGRAEARVHGVPVGRVHFHEVGAVDSMIDIVGTAICFHYLKVEKIYVRHLGIGKGVQRGSHGEMPVPVPGTYELLKGWTITQTENEQEMVTPTGAAILATCCQKSKKIPRYKLDAIGYGAGDRAFDGERGFLRISLGSTSRS